MSRVDNQARITEINSKLSRLGTDYYNATIRLNSAKTKQETLTTAQYQLNKLLENYYAFPSDYGSLGSSILDSQFRGSLREEVRVHLERIEAHLQTFKSRHEDRLKIIDDELTATENDVTSLTRQISTINTTVSLLESERRILLLS